MSSAAGPAAAACAIAGASCAADSFAAIDSSHKPSIVKMWEGMWRECKEAGAIAA